MQYTMEKIQNNYERNWRVITNEHWNMNEIKHVVNLYYYNKH